MTSVRDPLQLLPTSPRDRARAHQRRRRGSQQEERGPTMIQHVAEQCRRRQRVERRRRRPGRAGLTSAPSVPARVDRGRGVGDARRPRRRHHRRQRPPPRQRGDGSAPSGRGAQDQRDRSRSAGRSATATKLVEPSSDVAAPPGDRRRGSRARSERTGPRHPGGRADATATAMRNSQPVRLRDGGAHQRADDAQTDASGRRPRTRSSRLDLGNEGRRGEREYQPGRRRRANIATASAERHGPARRTGRVDGGAAELMPSHQRSRRPAATRAAWCRDRAST